MSVYSPPALAIVVTTQAVLSYKDDSGATYYSCSPEAVVTYELSMPTTVPVVPADPAAVAVRNGRPALPRRVPGVPLAASPGEGQRAAHTDAHGPGSPAPADRPGTLPAGPVMVRGAWAGRGEVPGMGLDKPARLGYTVSRALQRPKIDR